VVYYRYSCSSRLDHCVHKPLPSTAVRGPRNCPICYFRRCKIRQSKTQGVGKEGDTAKHPDAKGVDGGDQANLSVMCPTGAVWGADIVPPRLLKTHLTAILLCFQVNARKQSFGHSYISLSSTGCVATPEQELLEINGPMIHFNRLLTFTNGKRSWSLNMRSTRILCTLCSKFMK
jgi:hypothetical protein